MIGRYVVRNGTLLASSLFALVLVTQASAQEQCLLCSWETGELGAYVVDSIEDDICRVVQACSGPFPMQIETDCPGHNRATYRDAECDPNSMTCTFSGPWSRNFGPCYDEPCYLLVTETAYDPLHLIVKSRRTKQHRPQVMTGTHPVTNATATCTERHDITYVWAGDGVQWAACPGH